MNNIKHAWRNLWRNRRRTLITTASVFFAVYFAMIMRSMQLGTYDYMYKSVIETYSGYIQVQDKQFWEDRIVDNTFADSPELRNTLLEDPNVDEVIPRFESFALASSGERTKGIMVMGIDPQKEVLLSDVQAKLIKYRLDDKAIEELKKENIPDKIKSNLDLFRNQVYASDGRIQLDLGIKERDTEDVMPVIAGKAGVKNEYFKPGEKGALVGGKLADYLGLSMGDSIVLIGQGYHGTTAAGIFEVKGIVHLSTPDIDNRIIYLPVDVCQEFYAAPGRLTSMILNVNDNEDKMVAATMERLGSVLNDPYRMLDWREMNKTIVNQMDADNKSGMIMIGVLYLVIAFGVFGTVLMMTAERRREFGVIISIGMQKSKLAAIMVYEMILLGLLGIASGLLAAVPTILYGYYHPIKFSSEMAKMFEDYGFEPVMAFKWFDSYILWQSVVVGIILLIAAIYPMRKIYKLVEVNALKA